MLNPRTSISAQPRSFGFVFLGRLPDSTACACGIFLCKRTKRPKDIPLSLDALSSALSLLVFGVLADHHDLTVTLDDLALFTDFLY